MIGTRNWANLLRYFIALVWLLNGLFCKVLNLVPRHKQIVARILGPDYAPGLTVLIGLGEIAIAIWVFTAFKSRLAAITQIILVAAMNIIEYFWVPNLLLFGRFNALFAFIFILVIYLNEFVLNRKLARYS